MAGRHFFRRHEGRGSYDLFSSYSHYLPGVGGMFGLFGLFLLGALLGNVVILGLNFISPEFAETYGTVISYPVMFIPAMLYASVRSRLDDNGYNQGLPLDQSRFGRLGGLRMGVIVSIATIAAAFMTDAISSVMPEMPQFLQETMEKMMNGPLWISLLSVSIFAPLFEEWLCRGLVLRGLLTNMKPAAAIAISAAFFAVLHMNPWQAIPAFILGLLFGYVYYRTGSLKLTMLMHCVNNTMAVILGRIPALKNADTFLDMMSPWAYVCIFIACLAFIGATVTVLQGIPQEDEPKEGE